MAKKSTKAYLGLSRIVTIILAIIPFTNIVLGIVTRVLRKRYLPAICNIFLCPLFWIIDLITVIVSKDLTFFA